MKTQPNLNEIVSEYGQFVSGMAHRMIEDKELAKEAAQEVWYEVLNSLDTFKGNSAFSTWLYTIAKRTILKYAKNERVISYVDIEKCMAKGQIHYEDIDTKKVEWIKEKCDQCITAFYHCLNNDARLVFLFRENIGLSYTQISTVMELTEENVRKILSRSIKKLKNFMSNNCPLLNPKGTCGCRIKEEVKSIGYEENYLKFRNTFHMQNFFEKFDKDLPRKNYWVKKLNEIVTN